MALLVHKTLNCHNFDLKWDGDKLLFLQHSQETKLFILIWWLFILDIVEKLLFRLSIDLKSACQ